MHEFSAKQKKIGLLVLLVTGGALIVAFSPGLSCSRKSGKGGDVTHAFDAQLADEAVDQLLEQVRMQGLKALVPVVDDRDRATLRELDGKLQEQLRQLPAAQRRSAFDYRRDGDVARGEASGSDDRLVSVVLRRHAGEGEFTFRVNQQGHVLCLNEATSASLSEDDSATEVLSGLPPDLMEFELRLADPAQLGQVTLAKGGHVFAVVFGLAGNAERIDKVLVERKSHDDRLNQMVFHLTVFEKPIRADARLSADGLTLERVLRLGEKSPADFFQDRIASLESSD